MWIWGLLACSQTEVRAIDAEIVVQTEVIDYGDIVVDTTSTQELLISSTSTKALTISAITVESDQGEVFTTSELPPTLENGATWPLQVYFTPTDEVAYTGILTIESDDPDEPITVTLTGNGVPVPAPDIDPDADTYDFGAIAAGSGTYGFLPIRNIGNATLEITGMDQTGSGTFSIESAQTNTVDPGQSIDLFLKYSPYADTGDSGTIIIHSNDPDEPETTITLIGNGGGDNQYPVAVIDGPTEITPGELVSLSGAGSYDPLDLELVSYDWTVVSPDGSSATLTADADTATLQTDLAGTYTASLQVTNSDGLQSAPDLLMIEAIPNEDLHIELYWSTAQADLDLHLSNSSGSFFQIPGDISYCNKTADWGSSSSTADNPTLTLDDDDGYGPESIKLPTPALDTYTVRVHYFEDNGDGDVSATVNIYIRGELKESYTNVLTRDYVWDVAQIQWSEDASTTYVIEGSTDTYDSPNRACYE